MSQGHNTPSLYEMLTGNFTGDLNVPPVYALKRRRELDLQRQR